MASRFLQEIPDSLVTTRDIRGHSRVADRIPDPMWTKRAASTPAPKSAGRTGDQFEAGDKVRHGTFGDGVVVSSSGTGGDIQVTVAFAGQGVKRLMLSFAPLEKVVEEESARQFDPDEDEIEIQDPDLFAP